MPPNQEMFLVKHRIGQGEESEQLGVVFGAPLLADPAVTKKILDHMERVVDARGYVP